MHIQRKDSDVFPNIMFKEQKNCIEISGYFLANNLLLTGITLLVLFLCFPKLL